MYKHEKAQDFQNEEQPKMKKMPIKETQTNGKKRSSTRVNVTAFKVDTSAGKMKKVREYFKDIEHIKLPYSGIELQKMARTQKKIISL